MTEDVLEQVVDDYLRYEGYFTRSNVKFGPVAGDDGFSSREHNQHSDIDVLAVHPQKTGPASVLAVSCKAMQEGYSPIGWLNAASAGKTYRGRRAERARMHHREIWDPVWNRAHRKAVKNLTGADTYTYVLAVTKLEKPEWGDIERWRDNEVIGPNLDGLDLRVLTFEEMWSRLRSTVRTRVEPSHIGRLAQMLNAIEGKPTSGDE